jgi:Septum formation
MSTEAAGEARQDAVEARREVTAASAEADEAPGAGGNAGRSGRGPDAGGGPRADDEGAEPGADGQPDADEEPDAAGEPDAGADSGAGKEPAAAGEPGADGQADSSGVPGTDGADADRDDDAAGAEDAWRDDGDLPPDGDDLPYDEYDYEDNYEDDGEQGPDDGGTGRARRWPRVLLVTGFVLAAAAIVGGALAIVGSVTHGFKKPVKVTYKKSALFSLKTGDCFNPMGQAYTLTSCDDPHQAEVFATFPLAGAKYPGSTVIATAAAQGCASRLTGYLNPQLAISLASTYVYPDATAWQAGTRTVICEVQASSGQLTGSVRGASATAG